MLTVMMLTALLLGDSVLKMIDYKKKEEGGRQDDKENTAHLCRLAMRVDVKEWGCHFRPRDLIHRSEVNNKAEHDDQDGEEKVVVIMPFDDDDDETGTNLFCSNPLVGQHQI